jgi:hypothetical protein
MRGAGKLVRLTPEDAQKGLINNIVRSLKRTRSAFRKCRSYTSKADRAYRTRAAKGLGLNIEKIAASIDSMVAAD